MKKSITFLFLLIALAGNAQKITNLDDKKPRSKAVATKDFAIYKGDTLTVYKSINNKLFIIVTSKNGTKYNKYLN